MIRYEMKIREKISSSGSSRNMAYNSFSGRIRGWWFIAVL
jgi:hypothetical protein